MKWRTALGLQWRVRERNKLLRKWIRTTRGLEYAYPDLNIRLANLRLETERMLKS